MIICKRVKTLSRARGFLLIFIDYWPCHFLLIENRTLGTPYGSTGDVDSAGSSTPHGQIAEGDKERALKASFRFAEVLLYDRAVELCSRFCARGRVSGNSAPRCLDIQVTVNRNTAAFGVELSCLKELS